MPRYDYSCPHCGADFEASKPHGAEWAECTCGSMAHRKPYSGVPYLIAATATKAIPEEPYRMAAEKKDLAAKGWTAERSIEEIRKNIVEDNDGNKQLNVAAMPKE